MQLASNQRCITQLHYMKRRSTLAMAAAKQAMPIDLHSGSSNTTQLTDPQHTSKAAIGAN
jgi:hypothetical protein